MARSELNARFDEEERKLLKTFARENGVSEAAALRILVRRLSPRGAGRAKRRRAA